MGMLMSLMWIYACDCHRSAAGAGPSQSQSEVVDVENWLVLAMLVMVTLGDRAEDVEAVDTGAA